MGKYYQTDQLQKLIDWENIMKMPRYAGGHDDHMRGLFKDAIVIAHWNENDYQGTVATCVMLPDNRFVIYNDFYGSCSGCDAWEGAEENTVRSMCITLSNDAYVFDSINDVIIFLHSSNKDRYSWSGKAASGLLEEIMKNQQITRSLNIDKIIK